MIVTGREIALTLYGKPPTRYEPHIDTRERRRGERPRMFPDARTVDGMRRWQMEWRRQGSPYLKGPVEVELLVIRSRPQSHLLVNGVALSSEGHKYPIPPRPDCSNVLKLVEDALKRLAFGDDAEIACAFVSKAYGSPERCELVIRPWDDGATTPTLLEEEA